MFEGDAKEGKGRCVVMKGRWVMGMLGMRRVCRTQLIMSFTLDGPNSFLCGLHI